MALKNIEIEVQLQVENTTRLIEFLNAHGKFNSTKHQVDEYFSPSHRDFLQSRPIKEWLRLRNSDGTYTVNYKNWHYDTDGKSHYCDEVETNIESLDQVKKIFLALNFIPIVTVDKIRKTWIYHDYEVAIDSVKRLGNFVEIEYIGEDQEVNPAKVTGEMITFLKKIGVGKIVRNYVGYPFQILFPSEVKDEIV